MIGLFAYTSFIVANLWPTAYTLLPTAGVLGVGASIIWTAEGTYLTMAASNYARARGQPKESAMGFFNGIFFGIFQLNQVVGNLIAGFILNNHAITKSRVDLLMYIFIGLCGVSVVSMLFLAREEPPEPQGYQPPMQKIFKALLLFKDPRLLLLIPIFLYSGLEQSFNAGVFTLELITKSVGTGKVGFIMAVFGGANVAGSLAMGRIADRFGGWPLVIVGFVMNTIFLVSAWLINYHDAFTWIKSHEWYLYICAILLAIGDASWNTFPNTILGVYWPNNAEAAFANLKFWQSVGAVLPFAFGIYIGLPLKLELMMGFLSVGMLCLIVLQFSVASLSAPRKVDVIN
jgi:MFS family permease